MLPVRCRRYDFEMWCGSGSFVPKGMKERLAAYPSLLAGQGKYFLAD
jgi:hypothetical protein